MTKTSYCTDGGLLVGAGLSVPENAGLHRAGEELIGCNRIRCRACDALVRQFRGYRLIERPVSEDSKRLHDGRLAPSHAPFLTSAIGGEAYRVYTCCCSTVDAAGISYLRDSDVVDWCCAGHPS